MSIDQTGRLEKLSRAEMSLLLEALREKVSQEKKYQYIPRRANQNACSLSFAQQRLWFLDRLEPDSPLYNIPLALRLCGELNIDVLRRVLTEIARRHEVLRTTFTLMGKSPAQVVGPPEEVRLSLVDLSGFEDQQREAQVKILAREEARRPFDLARGPLWRTSLLRLGSREHVALFTMHHIVSDGWSIGVLINEVAALYAAYLRGRESVLPELDIQYADYAEWQREYLAGEVLEGGIEYWKTQLRNADVMDLPADHSRPAVASYRGKREWIKLGPKVRENLRGCCQREAATMFMVLMAAFKVVLMKYSGKEDVVVGTAVANRTRSEVKRLIGFFVNTLVMRTDLGGNPSFRDLVRREKEVALSAYAHQEAPFEKIVEAINPERDLSRNPLFQVMMVLQNTERQELEIEGLKVHGIDAAAEVAKFDLTLDLAEGDEGITGSIEYSCDLYDPETIRRMVKHLEKVVAEVARDAELRIREIEFMSKAERKQLIEEWNATQAEYPHHQCVHGLFEGEAARRPEAVAVVFGDEMLSYGELESRANQLANYLRAKGVVTESRVGVCAERSVEMVEAVLAVLKAGAACVPLDPNYPIERLRYMVMDGEVEWVVMAGDGVEAVAQLLEGSDAQILRLGQEREEIEMEASTPPPVDLDADHLLYVIYTSGSTGRPKGVALSHAALVNLICWDRKVLRAQARMLQFSSLNFDASFHEMFATWASGGTVVLISREQQLDPHLLSREIRERMVERLNLPAAVIDGVVGEMAAIGCDSVDELISTAEQMQIAGQWWEWLKEAGCAVWNHYGPSETHVITAWRAWGGGPGTLSHPPIGKPIDNCLAYILNDELDLISAGVIGELYLGGIGLARGYLNRPELTAERFIPDPHCANGGMRVYRTGDLARYLNDGSIEYYGRIDSQVKIRGYRVELGEIELALRGERGVEDAAVVMRQRSGGDNYLVAYVVGERRAKVDIPALRSALRQRLPEYMIPAEWMELERLPLTANGKLDRKSLPAPDRGIERIEVPPRTPLEEMIAGVWSEILGLDKVSVEMNFFEAGGHSLLAMQVVSRLRNMFGVEIGVKSVFEEQTITGLARRIEKAINGGEKITTPPLVRVGPQDRIGVKLPLSFAQQRLWFLDQLAPNNQFYNLAGAVRLEGQLELAVLERVINEILRRHEVLRTRIEVAAGEPAQVVDDWEWKELQVEDLRGLPSERRENGVKRIVREEAETSFDLSQGPLLRVKVLKLREEEHVLLITMHHIVSDGWSMSVMIREVCTLYQAMSEGKASPLPKLEIQYADYALWQREWMRGEVLENQLAYWKRQLASTPLLLQLPIARQRPSAQTYRGASEKFFLSQELSDQLKKLNRSEGVTMFMSLLMGFQLLLARYSGSDRIPVGSPIAGRNRKETEALIGFFVNTLVMVTDFSGNPTVRALLHRVRETAIGAFAHQDLPFEKLVEDLHPKRSHGQQPLFQVMFAFQNHPGEPLVMPNLKVREEYLEIESAKFELALTAMEDGGLVIGVVEYATDLYDRESIIRLLGHFRRLLDGITSNPESPAKGIPLLSEQEWEQVLTWNRTATRFAAKKCIHELFEEQAARTPDRIAGVAGVDEIEEISYRELNRRANQLGNYLRRRGVGPEVRVGICMERRVEMLVGLLGILKAGGAYLPLDPTYPAERLGFMLNDAAVRLIVTQEKLREVLKAEQTELICIDSNQGQIEREREENINRGVKEDNLAYVIYTSGSTGLPKGAMITHQSVINLTSDAVVKFRLGQESKFLQFAPLSFDVAVEEIYPVWSVGGSVILRSDEMSYAYSELEKAIELHEITTMELPTIYWGQWTQELSRAQRMAPRSLDLVIMGGERISPEILKEWKAHNISLLHVYGVTEVAVTSIVYLVPTDFGYEPIFPEIPIGRPMANVEVYLLDENLRPMPPSIPSEMYLGGVGLARGYLNRPELTAERFVPSPFGKEPGSRLYKSGDLARSSADGCLAFVGRADHQIKVRGFRVEIGEIEAALKIHHAVEEAVVTAVEDGSGSNKLVAYIVPRDGYREGDGTHKIRVPELWPAQGEYGVFDEMLYYSMTSDRVRNESYEEAMRRFVKDKTVVDIGTGADAILSRLCVKAGARRVYAIEMGEEACQKAKREIEREGLEEKIILIQGESRSVDLPEKADVCVSELIGTIGGAEGAVPILNDARRYLKEDGVMIPERCVTRVAGVELPEEIKREMAFTEVSGHYAKKVFEKMGRAFDLRVCIRNFPKNKIITSIDVFEELDFRGSIEPGYTREIELRIERRGKLEGLLLWINLEVINGRIIDVLEYDGCWSPAYMPVFAGGIEVEEGDEIRASCSAEYRNDGDRPDYRVRGVVNRRGRSEVEFDYYSRLEERSYKGNEFYRELLVGDGIRIGRNGNGKEISIARDLKDHIREILPEYMAPAAIVIMERLPLSPNGKVDRQALLAPDKDKFEHSGQYVAPSTTIEKDVAQIFGEILKIGSVGIHDDFFALGGHSLLVTRVISRVNRDFQIELPIRALFDAPTVSSLVAAIVASQAAQFDDDSLSQMLAEVDGPSAEELDVTFDDNSTPDCY